MNILAIIPARYQSTRFPGKPLATINGKTMIERVYARTLKAFEHVIVATDDNRILQHVRETGGKAVMTSDQHRSGTDRCYEAMIQFRQYTKLNFDVIINVQGDEPFIDPDQLIQLADIFKEETTMIGTLVKKIEDRQETDNPNVVKVVLSNDHNALYFSRYAIPYLRNENEKVDFYKHLGIYAYRTNVLEKITRLTPTMLENAESLEQLRWLENGFPVKCIKTHRENIAVDTPEDLKRAEKFARENDL